VLLRTIALAAFALLFATPGNAATRFVATNGTATTFCFRDAPCGSLTLALSAAAAGDTIVCVSPVTDGFLVIAQSVTIDCSTARSSIRDASVTAHPFIGISINIPPGGSNPTTVRLRGLDVDGARFFDRGIDILAASVVYIEDCVISNVNQLGIYDHRTGGQTKLFITDTVISGSGGAGIVLGAQAPNANVLDNVRSESNAYGIAAAGGTNVVINRSVFSANSMVGIEGDSGSQIAVNNSSISFNSYGVQSAGSVRLSNNDIAFNSVAISGPSGTFGNNRLSGNSAAGTVPTPVASSSGEFGQQ
jgi:Right handed beta helix region